MSDGAVPSPSPAVSILMPAYNAERYVGEAVRSLLGQTFGDFELLVVDDGSTDATAAILRDLAAADGRIRFVSRPNTGYLVALNQMLGMARGGLLARMDADDVAEPRRLERQVEHLREHPECVLVGSRVTLIDPDGAPLTVMPVPLDHEAIDRALLAGEGQMVYHPSVLMRRSAVEAVGPYRAEFYLAEDLDLFLRLAEVGRLANLAEPLLRYREHLGKVGLARLREQDAATRAVLVEAHRRRGLPLPESVDRRAGRGSPSAAAIRRCWAWMALNWGNLGAARKHARASLLSEPLSPDSWRLLYCVLRGR